MTCQPGIGYEASIEGDAYNAVVTRVGEPEPPRDGPLAGRTLLAGLAIGEFQLTAPRDEMMLAAGLAWEQG